MEPLSPEALGARLLVFPGFTHASTCGRTADCYSLVRLAAAVDRQQVGGRRSPRLRGVAEGF